MNGITILTSARPTPPSSGPSTTNGTTSMLSPTLKAVDSPVSVGAAASASTSTSTSSTTGSSLLPTPASTSTSTSMSTTASSAPQPPEPKAVSFSLPPVSSSSSSSNAQASTSNAAGALSQTDPNLPSSDPSQADGEITPSELAQLIEALRSSKDRIWLLRVGESMERLFSGTGPKKAEFNPPTSYQRMLVHRCASFYRLAPETDGASKAIVVTLTSASRIPKTRLQDLVPSEETPQVTIQIMRRVGSSTTRRGARSQSSLDAPSSSTPGGAGDSDGDGGPPSEAGSSSTTSKGHRDRKGMTIAEREAAYEAARSRIFGEEAGKGGSTGSLPLPTSAGSGGHVSPATSDVGGSRKSTLAAKSSAGSASLDSAANPAVSAPASNAPAPTDEEYDPAYDPSRRPADEEESDDVPRPSVPFPTLYNPHAPSQPAAGSDPQAAAMAAAVAAGYPIFPTYLQPIPVAAYGFYPPPPGAAAYGFAPAPGYPGVPGVPGMGYYASPYGGPYMWVAPAPVPGPGVPGQAGQESEQQQQQYQPQQGDSVSQQQQQQQMFVPPGAYGYGGMVPGMMPPGSYPPVQQQQQPPQQQTQQYAPAQGMQGQGMQQYLSPHASASDSALNSLQFGQGQGYGPHGHQVHPGQRGANGKHSSVHSHLHPHQHQQHQQNQHGHHPHPQHTRAQGQPWSTNNGPQLNLPPSQNGKPPNNSLNGRLGMSSGAMNGTGPGMSRSSWSFGPGIGALAPGPFDRDRGRMGAGTRSISGMSNGSGSGSGSRTPADDGSSTVSSSTSSSSRATYTSIGSGRHPLPPRPDWAIGLSSPTGDIVGDLRPTSAMSTSSGVSASSAARGRAGGLAGSDFPPLGRGASLPQKTQLGAWSGGSRAVIDAAHTSQQQQQQQQQQADDQGFARPGSKPQQELFDPTRLRLAGGLRPADSPAPLSPNGSASGVNAINLVPRQATPTQNGTAQRQPASVAAVDATMSEVLARLQVSSADEQPPAAVEAAEQNGAAAPGVTV